MGEGEVEKRREEDEDKDEEGKETLKMIICHVMEN